MVTQNDSSIDSQEKYTNLNIYHNQANRKRKKKKKEDGTRKQTKFLRMMDLIMASQVSWVRATPG